MIQDTEEVKSLISTQVIVGIGASAGGLQALKSFFDHVPNNSLYSYVVVQHLSPDHKSLMRELLGKETNIPIKIINNNDRVESNCVHLIPPGKNLFIEKGIFKLVNKPKGQLLNLPIDLFFESLAQNYMEYCAAVILSGTGSDGSRGIRAIKEHGGVVMVQQPDQAKFSGMPLSAINTGLVDYVIPTEHISQELSNYFESRTSEKAEISHIDFKDETLKNILDILRDKTDLDFNLYKRPTLLRRLARRFRILKMESPEDYLFYLKDNDDEIQNLYREFLIGVTKFFRDPRAWEILKDQVFPKLIQEKKDGEVLKVWDVGCSTGEEPFSIAMALQEEIKRQGRFIEIKIFATDISQDHLNIASKGKYSENIVTDLSATQLSSFFKVEDNEYIIKEELRQTVIFSNHNIIKDPPFKNMDLVVCRNLLIYLKPSVQNKVTQVLHYALNRDGFLVLGHSENLGEQVKHFGEINRKWNIYQNIEETKRLRRDILKSNGLDIYNFNAVGRKKKSVDSYKLAESERLKIEISKALLEELDAASVVIDASQNILEAMGPFKNFANFPENGFSRNLSEVLPRELSLAVTDAIRKALRKNTHIYYKDILLSQDAEKARKVDLLVKPLIHISTELHNQYVVTFLETAAEVSSNVVVERAAINKNENERIYDLEEELEATQHDLNSALEEAEASNEELQASNEELLASNEELQSTNEELQSVNEELHTVNTEHMQKMKELALLNADMDNLLDSTRIGVVFLDRNLTIRKFTPAIKEHFNLMRQDIGRPIDNFISNFNASKKSSLVANSKKVLETEDVFERRIVSRSGKHYIKRISPFYSDEKKIDGVVIVFIEITKIHQSQEQLRRSEEKFKAFYENDPVMHVSHNLSTGNILECNALFYKTLGYKFKKTVIGNSIFDYYTTLTKERALSFINTLKNGGKIMNEEMMMVGKDKKEFPVILNADTILNDEGKIIAVRSTLVDITELKETQKELEIQKEDLLRTNEDLEQFVSICSHDLQEPLATIRFSSDFLATKYEEEFSEKSKEYLGYIHEASGRMSEQIKGLLQHSRIGKDVVRERVKISQLIEIVKYDLSKRIRDTQAQVYVGKMPILMGHKLELRLLFQNLISNAIKYRKPNENPVVRISSYTDSGFHFFAIVDNGIGIKEHDLNSIFKIFSRVPTEEKYEGTGVGLAHCEKIVKLHEGKIWVDSEYGVGSTFHFKIKA